MTIRIKNIYLYKQFSEAVRILATGPGDIRSRLHTAWRGQLYLIEPDKINIKYRDDMKWIINQLHKYEEYWPGQLSELKDRESKDPTYKEKYSHQYPDPVEATLSRIKNKTGVKIAWKIYGIYDSLFE